MLVFVCICGMHDVPLWFWSYIWLHVFG